MATREQRELIDQINALAKKLDVEPPKSDGLSTQQLNERLEELRRLESTQAGAQTPPKTALESTQAGAQPTRATIALESPTERSSPSGSSGYRVARGRSLISGPRGHLDEGAEVTEADVQGGKQHLDELVKAGVLEQGTSEPTQPTSGQPGPGGEPVAPAPGQTTDPNVQQTNQPGTEPGK